MHPTLTYDVMWMLNYNIQYLPWLNNTVEIRNLFTIQSQGSDHIYEISIFRLCIHMI